MISCFLAEAQAITEGKIASMPRSSPDSANSPINSNFSSGALGICSEAARIPIAMARSKRLPPLGSSAGARLTVMRRLGNSNLELISALRTRSLLSLTAVSGRPTILKAG
jgi:hypothetical protein